jgi:predicted site-specific integrase-resolvase
MSSSRLLSVQQAAQHFGVHPQTIRVWTNDGTVKSIRTPTGQRRIVVEDKKDDKKENSIKAIYCRVSSAKQKDDLQRQIDYLKEKYPSYQIFKDIGSGINFQRKGLLTLLDMSLQGLVEEVVVTSRDRLCRFAFELLSWMFERQGTKLTVLEQTDESPECELSNDVLSIIQVFCCRRNGKRR